MITETNARESDLGKHSALLAFCLFFLFCQMFVCINAYIDIKVTFTILPLNKFVSIDKHVSRIWTWVTVQYATFSNMK